MESFSRNIQKDTEISSVSKTWECGIVPMLSPLKWAEYPWPPAAGPGTAAGYMSLL